jgi:ribulose kinase
MEDIVNELLNTIKWIPERERQSKWYDEYLDKVNQDLKNENNGKMYTLR